MIGQNTVVRRFSGIMRSEASKMETEGGTEDGRRSEK
jgi:hypothetical protein